MEKYEVVREIGSGNFGVAKLMRNKDTQRLLVIKFIQRGHRIDENVFREILNHRALRHPNIIRFEEVVLTPTHLGIVMEYAEGGDLFDRIDDMERFHENEARYFFQQLVCGVSYCHAMHICHRDLKLENTLLHHDTRRSSLCLKICDFGYSKSWVLDSRPKSTVGTPAYIAPEVLSQQEYDGTHADVWSCGVILYVMLVGGYPFEDTDDPKNFHKTIARIKSVQYKIPDNVHVSDTCRHLLSRILVADPRHRITMAKIKAHPWYLNSLPSELRETAQQQYYNPTTSAAASSNGYSMQSVEEIIKIVQEAKKVSKLHSPMYLDDNQEEKDEEDDKTVREVHASGDFNISELQI